MYCHAVPISMVTTDSLLAICDVPHRNDVLKLIISSLDYSQDVYGRVVLTKILTGSDQVCLNDVIAHVI